jgi:sensor histidine kinase YesM
MTLPMSERSKQNDSYTHLIHPAWLRWSMLLGSWTIFGLFMGAEFYFLSVRAGNSVTWGAALSSELLYASVWLVLTPVIFRLAWKFPFQKSNWFIRGIFHLFASVLASLLHRAVFLLIILTIESTPETPFSWNVFSASVLRFVDYGIMIYWIIVLVRHSIEYYQRYRQQELQKSQLEAELNLAQLRALKMQLQPHFLFNTLNGISVLVRKDPDAACAMISRLADLLRMTLENPADQVISLSQEMKMLSCYLDIEHIRFADRLKVTFDIPAETTDALVPNLILQPLVENALKHGVAKQRGLAEIVIRSARNNGSLELTVKDSGPGVQDPSAVTEGIGFMNTRSRLRKLYGDKCNFDFKSREGVGSMAIVRIPFHVKA